MILLRLQIMSHSVVQIHLTKKAIVAAALRTILSQPDRAAAGHQLAEVVQSIQARWPMAAELLAEAEEEVLACMAFRPDHRSRILSSNPLERLNKRSSDELKWSRSSLTKLR